MAEQQQTMLRQDSIAVSQTASGKWTYDIKRYYDSSIDEPNLVIDAMKRVYDYAKQTFEGFSQQQK